MRCAPSTRAGTPKPISALVLTSANAKCGNKAMQNDQMNVTELCSGNRTMAPLFLLQLMRDLAVLEEQLRTAEDAMGGPVSTYILLRSGYRAWGLAVKR